MKAKKEIFKKVFSEIKNDKTKGLKVILAIVLAMLPILLYFTITVIVIYTVLITVGIIDIEGIGNSYNENLSYYSEIENTITYYWPIGGSETEEKDGVLYATGTPTSISITSNFGSEEEFRTSTHKGLDIGASSGEGSDYIIASHAGTVIYPEASSITNYGTGYYGSSDGGGFGNYVAIQQDDGTIIYYAHMYADSITVVKGDTVKKGQVIGKIGSSGSSTGAHLHFEVRVNNEKVNPLNYIDPDNPRPHGEYIIADLGDSSGASENKKAICEALLSEGYTENAVAGMLVNIHAEGYFLTNNMQDSYENNGDFGTDEKYTEGVNSGAYSRENFINDEIGYGLIQWTDSSRKTGLYDAAKEENKSIADLKMQFNYLFKEIKSGSYIDTVDAITDETKSAEEIATTFCLDFEKPANKETKCPERARSVTKEYLDYVTNGCQ